MANWNDILKEIQSSENTFDLLRRKYLKALYTLTNRNIIIYYSAWLDKPGAPSIQIEDLDKNGFMNAIHGLDKSRGLDLILHTPGGDTAATESLVDYLRSIFGTDIRAIVPQLAMSGGTMIACACKEIIMGKHSSLGPIDPQFGGIPAHGFVEEWNRAHKEISQDQSKIAVWQFVLQKVTPTFLGQCEKAIKWSEQMTRDWLLSGMLLGKDHAPEIANRIISELGNTSVTLSHSRHLSIRKCEEIGLTVVALEDDPALQDAVLSIHHVCMQTMSSTAATKIIENHNGIAYVRQLQQIVQIAPSPQ